MKISKGDAGYIRAKKKRALLKTILEFGIVIALLILGITQTGDRLNLLTLVAVLGCLPASKAMVELIMILPHQSTELQKVQEIAEKAEHLSVIYDMVFTSEKKIMPVKCMVLSDNTVCGYVADTKVDVSTIGQHIKQYLSANQFSKVTVKLFEDYAAFLARTEEMNHLSEAKEKEMKKREEAIRRVILNLSL